MVTSVSPTSAQWVEQLVNQTMAFERRPLTRLETQRDTLEIKNAVYNDISSKIEAVQDSIEALIGSTYGLTNTFNAKAISVANADPDIDVADVSLDGTSAVPGVYELNVTKLAQSHQIGSAQQAQSSEALGLSGTFIIGGASSRSVSGNLGASNPVTGFGTGGAIRENQLELGSGAYSVEFRQNDGVWQFRVVNEDGDAVSIDDAADADTAMTSNWQNFDQVKGTTFDTGRGLTITFDNVDPTGQQLHGGANTASADYTAQGASITVDVTDSLNDIRSKISKATFAEGNEVQATIVDRRLVLTGSSTGANAEIKLFDSSYSGTAGNGVLKSLGIEVNDQGELTDKVNDELRAAQDAEFSINNINITRSSNTGLTDVVQGLSFDLQEEGSSTITITKDNDGVVDDVKTLLDNVNNLIKFMKAKTEPVVGQDDENGNPTYTPAPLGTDWSMRWLGQDIANKLLSEYTNAVGDAPKYLVDLGISLNDEGLFQLSDASAFTAALNDDFAGVESLFNDILGNLDNELDKYIDGSGSIIETTQSGLETELEDINDRIDSYENLLAVREEALRTQYASIQAQLISMTYQYQSFQAFSTGSLFNQQY